MESISDTRFALLKELSHEPPFWFDHALTFCRFKPSQLDHLLEATIKRPGADNQQTSVSVNNSPWHIQQAVECGLLEPILQSVAEYNGDLNQLMNTLMDAMDQNFPWIFLAYFGTRNKNTPLVKHCVARLNEDLIGGKMLTNEIGMLYMVWRFLVRAKCGHECEEFLKHQLEAPISHDWTFVHLASAYGDNECLEILLQQPCNQNHKVLTAATELEGFTPLHLAAFYGHHGAIKLLVDHAEKFPSSSVEHDVLVTIPRDRVFGRSPLHYASMQCFPAAVSILVEKWGSLGVDLQDYFGITALHLAAASERGSKDLILMLLIQVAQYPDHKVSKDFALQIAAMTRLLINRRLYVNSTTSTMFIPSPRIAAGFIWALQGFNVFHYVAVHATEEIFSILIQKWGETLFWDSDDAAGLKPSDYSATYTRFNDLFGSLETANRFVDRARASSKLREGVSMSDQRSRLLWAYAIDTQLVSGRYTEAFGLCDMVDQYIGGLQYRSEAEKKFKLDDEVWNHLEWALDKALQQQDSSHYVSSAVPRLLSWDAEEMLLVLIKKKVFHGKSSKQRCLQWAISKRMARLADELVKDTV